MSLFGWITSSVMTFACFLQAPQATAQPEAPDIAEEEGDEGSLDANPIPPHHATIEELEAAAGESESSGDNK